MVVVANNVLGQRTASGLLVVDKVVLAVGRGDGCPSCQQVEGEIDSWRQSVFQGKKLEGKLTRLGGSGARFSHYESPTPRPSLYPCACRFVPIRFHVQYPVRRYKSNGISQS